MEHAAQVNYMSPLREMLEELLQLIDLNTRAGRIGTHEALDLLGELAGQIQGRMDVLRDELPDRRNKHKED